MAFSSLLSETAFLLSRVLFALVIGYLALGNLLDLESSVGYAESKGAPLATVTVPLGSLGLIAGALAVLTGVYPAVGALAVITFLVPITVIMHDFWTMEGQSRQNEQIHFLKNVGLLGSALVFLALSTVGWPLAVGLGL
jgi:putative oxidoreductase